MNLFPTNDPENIFPFKGLLSVSVLGLCNFARSWLYGGTAWVVSVKRLPLAAWREGPAPGCIWFHGRLEGCLGHLLGTYAMLCQAPRRAPVQPPVRFDKQRPVHRARQQLFATVIRVASSKKMLRIKVFNVGDAIKTGVNLLGAVFARDRRR